MRAAVWRQRQGILQIGAAISAKIKRYLVQTLQPAGKMHQAAVIITMLKMEKVADFMERNFSRSFIDLRRW